MNLIRSKLIHCFWCMWIRWEGMHDRQASLQGLLTWGCLATADRLTKVLKALGWNGPTPIRSPAELPSYSYTLYTWTCNRFEPGSMLLTRYMHFAVQLYVYVCMHMHVIQLHNDCRAHVRCWLSRSCSTHWSTGVKIIALTAWQQPLLSSPLSKVRMFSLKRHINGTQAQPHTQGLKLIDLLMRCLIINIHPLICSLHWMHTCIHKLEQHAGIPMPIIQN